MPRSFGAGHYAAPFWFSGTPTLATLAVLRALNTPRALWRGTASCRQIALFSVCDRLLNFTKTHARILRQFYPRSLRRSLHRASLRFILLHHGFVAIPLAADLACASTPFMPAVTTSFMVAFLSLPRLLRLRTDIAHSRGWFSLRRRHFRCAFALPLGSWTFT